MTETKPMRPRRGIASIADIKARCIVDPVTLCWHWQAASFNGQPRLWAFDHERGDKRVMSGPTAVWNIAHGESPRGRVVFRRCGCHDCMNPVHMGLARDLAEVGAHIARAGYRKGVNVEARTANIHRAWQALGLTVTPPEVVIAIRRADRSVTNRELARIHGRSEQTVSKIRRGELHKHVIDTQEAA